MAISLGQERIAFLGVQNDEASHADASVAVLSLWDLNVNSISMRDLSGLWTEVSYNCQVFRNAPAKMVRYHSANEVTILRCK